MRIVKAADLIDMPDGVLFQNLDCWGYLEGPFYQKICTDSAKQIRSELLDMNLLNGDLDEDTLNAFRTTKTSIPLHEICLEHLLEGENKFYAVYEYFDIQKLFRMLSKARDVSMEMMLEGYRKP
jgi:hypothetical protein